MNKCTYCQLDLGDDNPRQYCEKDHCPQERMDIYEAQLRDEIEAERALTLEKANERSEHLLKKNENDFEEGAISMLDEDFEEEDVIMAYENTESDKIQHEVDEWIGISKRFSMLNRNVDARNAILKARQAFDEYTKLLSERYNKGDEGYLNKKRQGYVYGSKEERQIGKKFRKIEAIITEGESKWLRPGTYKKIPMPQHLIDLTD